jgi:hypothetical protein
MDNAMSEQPNDDGVKCSDIINGEVWRKRDNLTIEQCAIECDLLAASVLDEFVKHVAKRCAEAIRKLKKQEKREDTGASYVILGGEQSRSNEGQS